MNSMLRMPRRVLFGRGAIGAAGEATREYGDRALICTDENIARTDAADRLRKSLSEKGVRVREFTDTLPEIPLSSLESCVAFAQEEPVDMVIGFGGGSCIDMAKLTALLFTDPGPVARFYGENKIERRVLPIIGIPTTAGTGSEVTPGAVCMDPERPLKVGVSDPHLIPEVAICDPEATVSCPPSVTAVAGVDALVHAVESYCTPPNVNAWSDYPGDVYRGRELLTRHYALIALERIARSLARAFQDGSDVDAREDMLFGSLCAGLAFAHSGCGSAHALQYPVGYATHTPHGLGVALLLPYTLEISRPEVDVSLVDVARALGVYEGAKDPAGSAIDEISRLIRSVGIPLSLEQLGVGAEELDALAQTGIGITRLVRNSPREMNEADYRRILRAAWAGRRELSRSDG